jgi:hypothetical protein
MLFACLYFFGDFLNNSIFSGSNFVWQKTSLFIIFDFPGVTGLEKVKGRGPHFENFETEKGVK